MLTNEVRKRLPRTSSMIDFIMSATLKCATCKCHTMRLWSHSHTDTPVACFMVSNGRCGRHLLHTSDTYIDFYIVVRDVDSTEVHTVHRMAIMPSIPFNIVHWNYCKRLLHDWILAASLIGNTWSTCPITTQPCNFCGVEHTLSTTTTTSTSLSPSELNHFY